MLDPAHVPNKRDPKLDDDPRAIRVFVSSTFRDMGAERDELVKRVFPRLRRMCEEREVVWNEVDLRWGITESEQAEGRLLPICLEEIERCRPFFIGLIGERYGSVQLGIPDEISETAPWLAAYRGRSVTEIEMRHGVLNNPSFDGHAFFYFRDPAYLQRLPPGVDQADFETRDPEAQGKLLALKQAIRQSRCAVREGFTSPEELGTWVFEDFCALVDRLYPLESVPSPRERERKAHTRFARERAESFLGQTDAFEVLDAHLEAGTVPLVVTGQPGMGKSALLAAWSLGLQTAPAGPRTEPMWRRLLPRAWRTAAQSAPPVAVRHFVGATSASGSWPEILKAVMAEIAVEIGLSGEIPDKPDALCIAFPALLAEAAARRRILIVLDGLDRLEDRPGARDLVWLPVEIPANVRLVVSAAPGPVLDELVRRRWQTFDVGPLGPSERKELLLAYLSRLHKRLEPAQVARIAASPGASSPLYLRLLSQELRIHGDHASLDTLIEGHLSAASVPQLFARMLDRWETDYERERPGLVRDALSLLWGARRGLSESELLDLLGSDGAPLPDAYWSPLHLAADFALATQSGLLAFSHDQLRQAILGRFLASPEARLAVHRRLADYFLARAEGPRRVDELPWQLAEAGDWAGLASLLAEVDFFTKAWQQSASDVQEAWARIASSSDLRMVDYYRHAIDAPEAIGFDANSIGRLLAAAGHVAEAIAIARKLYESDLADLHPNNRHILASDLAASLFHAGRLDEAMEILERANTDGEPPGALQTALNAFNRAGTLYAQGQLDEASDLYRHVEDLCTQGLQYVRSPRGQQDDSPPLDWLEPLLQELIAGCLSATGQIAHRRGDRPAALSRYAEAERIYRLQGSREDLCRMLQRRADVHLTAHSVPEALSSLRELERLCRQFNLQDALQECLGRMGLVTWAEGDRQEGERLLREQEAICRAIGNDRLLADCLSSQASCLDKSGDLDRARGCREEELGLRRQAGSDVELAPCLGELAVLELRRGNADRAFGLLQETERISRQHALTNLLQSCIGWQALLHFTRDQTEEAARKWREQEAICREFGYDEGLEKALLGQAKLLMRRGEPEAALQLLREHERVAGRIGDAYALAIDLDLQGRILGERGDPSPAAVAYARAADLFRKAGILASAREALESQACMSRNAGDLPAAKAAHDEEERLSREMGDAAGLARALLNRAITLAEEGSSVAAIAEAHRARERAAGAGLHGFVSTVDAFLARFRP